MALLSDLLTGGAPRIWVDETGAYHTPDGMEFIRRFGVAYDKARELYPHLKLKFYSRRLAVVATQ